MKNKEIKTKGALHYYLQSTSGIVGAVLVLIMVIVAICSIFGITPYDPVEQHIDNILQGPSAHFWFGTDDFGRDVFSRTLEGMRRSLTVSITAVSLATILGVTFGILAGYVGKWFDQLVTRVSDVFLPSQQFC